MKSEMRTVCPSFACRNRRKDSVNKVDHWLQLSLSKQMSHRCPKRKAKRSRIYLNNNTSDQIYFTVRESDCVYLLLKENKRKQIAKKLNISIRTVDSYITSARDKLDAKNIKRLLELITKTEFYKRYKNQIKEIF